MPTKRPRRIAVFSDIHGNLHALEAVLTAIDALGIKDRICCGDVVGYGAYPNECIERLRAEQIPTLAGNHDHAAIDLTDITFFNEIAREAVFWTRSRLTAQNAEWLHQLPYTCEIAPNFFFAHATPYEPERWGYVLTFGDARLAMSGFTTPFCFIGHSHVPAVIIMDGQEITCPELEEEVAIVDGQRYLINVGSVGQPRDRRREAAFVEVDLTRKLIVFHHVPYDVAGAQEAIRTAGLPPELAERLAYGL